MRKRNILMTALLGGALAASGTALAESGSSPTGEEMQRPTATEQPTQDPAQTQQRMQQRTPERDREHMPDVSAPAPTAGASSDYVVQKGDTLGSIAKEKLGSRDQWQRIARANDLSDPNTLRVGQHLKIPEKQQDRSRENQNRPSQNREDSESGRSSDM